MKRITLIGAASISILFAACSRSYDPINYGEDACTHCKMTIVDDRFAAELVDSKGKAYKFDDVLCMKQYIAEQNKQGDNLLFVEDFLKKQDGAINGANAIYLKHEFFGSPMNGDYAAFENEADARHFSDSLGIQPVKWENL